MGNRLVGKLSEIGLRAAKTNADRLIRQRAIVAVYGEHEDDPTIADQVGTGFIVDSGKSHILVTAKHTLYGAKFNEQPFHKAIFVNGSLKRLDEINDSDIAHSKSDDIAALHIVKAADVRGMAHEQLEINPERVAVISLVGFLCRDLKRSRTRSELNLAPLIYSNRRIDYAPGYVALAYPRFRNKSAGIRTKVRAPVPRGLSGCPMLDTALLARGKIGIVGVFTDYKDGKAIGPSATKIRGLLDFLTTQM
jgi:hypothetical protein